MWGADLAAEQPVLAPLYEALLARTPVGFGYQASGATKASPRSVEPYGLVHRRGHWYLVGRDHDREAIRAFRVSRMSGPVKSLDSTFEPPEGFDADAHLGGEAWEIGPGDATAVIRFDPSIRWWAEQNLHNAPQSEAPGGSLDVELGASNLDALASWAIGFGDDIEIVSPPEARQRLKDHLAPFAGTAK